jgi:hypothetical protein
MEKDKQQSNSLCSPKLEHSDEKARDQHEELTEAPETELEVDQKECQLSETVNQLSPDAPINPTKHLQRKWTVKEASRYGTRQNSEIEQVSPKTIEMPTQKLDILPGHAVDEPAGSDRSRDLFEIPTQEPIASTETDFIALRVSSPFPVIRIPTPRRRIRALCIQS